MAGSRKGSSKLSKVYIAAPWADRKLAEWAAGEFEKAGHKITHDWWNHDGPQNDHQFLQKCAIDDFMAVEDADALVLYNTQKRGEETSGKQVEFGLALAWGKQIYVIGERWTNVFHLMPDVVFAHSVEAILGQIN
jgi:hypothetical protein